MIWLSHVFLFSVKMLGASFIKLIQVNDLDEIKILEQSKL